MSKDTCWVDFDTIERFMVDVFKGIGVPVITDYEIWKNNPEKVFGMTREFTEKYPNTTVRIVKAMLRAAHWLDANNNANRPEAVKILSRSEYVGADYDVIANRIDIVRALEFVSLPEIDRIHQPRNCRRANIKHSDPSVFACREDVLVALNVRHTCV